MDIISLIVYWRRSIFVNRFKIRAIRAIRQIRDSDKRKERERKKTRIRKFNDRKLSESRIDRITR